MMQIFLKKSFLLVVSAIIFPAVLIAQDMDTFDGRKQWLLKGMKDVELRGSGKYGLPKACARLWNNPDDTTATAYITSILHRKGQTMFDFPGVALALGKYRNSFTPGQIAVIKADLERLAKNNNKNGEGFLSHGTENQATMMWASAYLFGQYFPDAKWANGMSSTELMAEMKERLRKTFQNVYEKGYAEYLSTTYEIVVNFPVAILYEFAEDREVKEIAEAFLLYKWSIQSLNNFEGRIIAPYARMTRQEDYQPADQNVTGTLYQHWLYWGWGEHTGSVRIKDFKNYPEASYTIYSALSEVTPEPLFNALANKRTTPASLRSSASTFGKFGSGIPHMMMRNVYRDKQFAIGTGNFRWVPGGDYADHDTNAFHIIWESQDRFNYINCFHPYWYADDNKNRTPDTWYRGCISPFMQTAHYESTAIILFDIPQQDPWPGKPNPAKWAWRDEHARELIKRGMLRYPASMDEIVEKNGWIFLREGKTYIGIKPLQNYYIQDKNNGAEGFIVVKSDFAKTGFIFEVGTENEYAGFRQFEAKLLRSSVSVNWKSMELTYLNPKGNKIRMQYNAGLPIDADGLANSVPAVWVNEKAEISYKDWPMIESPEVHMNNRVLTIQNNTSEIRVDWNNRFPSITRANTASRIR
ncbi:hypothetical protein FEM33_21780 [Dyadobacter flavalbus]|uniref:Uncharacterized protein n=1 Tax=Dyadobacter flavalbus TaxID=2579942 RepID=A0A5M8QQ32_9BACT|nr:hypothetical protein [Dyadobacter flavalbus]KAA6436766.1 hypothetical protein FEM33_21780 [Dyadobacter flavalbus]